MKRWEESEKETRYQAQWKKKKDMEAGRRVKMRKEK